MKSLFGGSAAIATALLTAATLFYASPSNAVTPADPQETKTAQQEKKDSTPQTIASAEAQMTDVLRSAAAMSDTASDMADVLTEEPPAMPVSSASKSAEKAITPAAAENYTATAYSLPGRGASGMPVGKGTIAADPRVLPFGTRVRLEAGQYSGEYVVTDAGSGVKGRKIDVWVPSYREACRFGRRTVKLTVISYGPKKTPRKSR